MTSPYSLPSNWKTKTDTQLHAYLTTIQAEAADVDLDAPGAEASDDSPVVPSGLDQIEAYAEAKTEIESELARRSETATADEARRDAALAALAPTVDPEPDEDEDIDTQEAATDEAATEELTADETPTDPETAPATPVVETVPAESVVDELADEATTETETQEEEPVTRDAAAVTRSMNARRSPTETQVGESGDVARPLRATASLAQYGVQPGEIMDIETASRALADSIRGNRGWEGARTKDYAIHADFGFEDGQMLGQGEEIDYAILQSVVKDYQDEQLSLVASGGSCAPVQPTYDIFSAFGVQRPIEAALPTVGAPRGGYRFIVPPGFAQARGAIDVKDSTALATTPGAGWVDKNCIRVTCPPEVTVNVAAISQCVTFDNLNFRVFPEQVADFMRRVAAEFARAKEIYYLDRINALAGAAVDISASATQTQAYGLTRSLYRELRTIAHNYRKRENMDTDAILDVFLPDVLEEALAVDMTNDASVGLSILAGPGGNLVEMLARKARLNVNFYYYDADVTVDPTFPPTEHSDLITPAYNVLPTVARSYIYAPGSIVRPDAGTLDVGPFRDSALNRTNDVELFAEQWVEIANPGLPIVAHDHTYCFNGTAPVGAVALTC